MLMAMAGGLYTAHRLWPQPAPPVVQQPGGEKADFEAKMLQNLGAIENLRVYGNVGDIDEARGVAEAVDGEDAP